ncbi:MAG: hypothetical protein K5831_07800 [Brevundimonas sp.]|jgi:hypothetical protein|uniref:hypothetical protein n=1 Tax=Brevundimonas sp. TaxID=1871086 RepID=UPI00258919AC|nr:hypothetical protein [Brevundimonas sp.]MCV0414772.1 hypothetical protein [Brevundimonas sp.]
MRAAVTLAAFAAAALVGACSQGPDFDFEPGVCYFVARPEGEPPRLEVVARDQAQIEFCAARLEEMRLRFLRMGGSNQEIVGAYQGRFVFVDREGVKIGQSLDGSRFFAMARTGDGRLAIPGAIARDDTGRPVAVAPAPEGR